MRKRQPLISAVLAVALLLGQWLAAGHDTEHSLQPGATHACAICVYAHGAGSGALPSALFVPRFDFTPAAPAVAAAATPRAVLVRLHPIRGPPTLLA